MTFLPLHSAFFPRLRLPLLLTMLLVLSGCGDTESAQRQAFIDFLQTRVLAKSALAVPALSDNQRKDYGPYAADYTLFTDYHEQMNAVFNASLRTVFSGLNDINSMSNLMERHSQIQRMIAASADWQPALVTLRQQVDSRYASLQQPEDVHAVFQRAYEKLIVEPDAAARQTATLVPQVLTLISAQIDLLQQQGDAVELTGNSVHFTSQRALQRYQALQQQLEPLAADLMKNAERLQAQTR